MSEKFVPNLQSNLRAIAICFRILGGVVGLTSSLLTILIFSRVLVTESGMPFLGPILFGLLFIVIAAPVTFALFAVAEALENCRRRIFCIVAAWLICGFFPLGTVLGVFTILQLTRPGAEEAFAQGSLLAMKVEDIPGAEALHS